MVFSFVHKYKKISSQFEMYSPLDFQKKKKKHKFSYDFAVVDWGSPVNEILFHT